MAKLNCILLIDDDSITNFINERLIRKLNVTNGVKVAMNGEEAIQYIEGLCEKGELCPELILLDINMPVMNGFEFIRAFENLNIKNKDKVKIIILTTSKNIKDVELLKSLGNFEFINKPLTEEKLFNCLSKITA
ncbi:MAG TPA: response regulator [Cytophagaceae bacterium]|jgi:CheY-like chemotaxis protein|nr:response regulator [Cytophagaceae bacterium]